MTSSLVSNGNRFGQSLMPDLTKVSTEDLLTELARGLTLTADVLARLGEVWAELERRGQNLSHLRKGMAKFLPMIAARLLAPEAVVAFAGSRQTLRRLIGVDLDEQRALAAGKKMQVIDPARPDVVETLPLEEIPQRAVEILLVDGKIRTPAQQRLAIRPERRRQSPIKPVKRLPHYDPKTGTVQIGQMKVELKDLMSELAAAAGPELPLATDLPDEYLTIKVRLSKEEHGKLLELARKAGLPEWEMTRKALRAFGMI